MVLLPILCLEMVHLEPLPLPLPGNVPYYKKQGIEKFIDEDDRLRKHCKMLIDSGAEVENLVKILSIGILVLYYNNDIAIGHATHLFHMT